MKLQKIAGGRWVVQKRFENRVMRRSSRVSIHGDPSPEKKDDETLLPRLPVIIHELITMRGWLEDRSFLLK